MDDEERWGLRVLMITGTAVDGVFHASVEEVSPSYKPKSRKIKGSGDSKLITSIQPWGIPDTSQRDRPKYYPGPRKPQYETPLVRNLHTGLIPMVPGYPPQLLPGVGLIPHVVRAWDYWTIGTEYHYSLDAA